MPTEEEENEDACPICFYDMDLASTWVCTRCKKSLHEYCASRHFYENNNSCPLCGHEEERGLLRRRRSPGGPEGPILGMVATAGIVSLAWVIYISHSC